MRENFRRLAPEHIFRNVLLGTSTVIIRGNPRVRANECNMVTWSYLAS